MAQGKIASMADLRHRQFAVELAKPGVSQAEAYKRVYGNKVSQRTAEANGSKLLHNAEVQAELVRRVNSWSKEYLLDLVHDEATKSKNKTSDKLNALTLLLKAKSYLKDDQPSAQTNILNVFDIEKIRNDVKDIEESSS